MGRDSGPVGRAATTALLAVITAGSVPFLVPAPFSSATTALAPPTVTAATFAQRLVARAPLAQNSTETDQPPDSRLDWTGHEVYAGTIVRKRWWTVDESRDTAYDEISAQTPAGTRRTGTNHADGVKGVYYDPRRIPGSVYTATLIVEVVALNHSQSAVGAFAVVVRQPKRHRRENVKPHSLRAVHLVHETYPSGDVLRRRTVTGQRAARLARVFNRMSVIPAHRQGCPMSRGTTTIVKFLGRHHTWVVSPFCGAPQIAAYDVQRDGQVLPWLGASSYKYRWLVHRALRS